VSGKSDLSQPAMSHHFAKLSSAGIIVDQKVGTQKSYSINREFLAKLGINVNKL
jgi:predicted transcriptional regulator